MFRSAGLVAAIATLSTVGPNITAAPPYFWGPNVRLIKIGGVGGAIIGAVYTYFSVDRAVKKQAKKEVHRYSKPEARLISAMPGLVLATLGLLTFGLCAQNKSPHAWAGLEFGFGMVAFGLMQAPAVGFSYVSSPSRSTSTFLKDFY